MPTLICRSGPLAGQRFDFDAAVIIGREDATVTIADEEASRRHAAIHVAGGDIEIEDLGSTNGTYVDGRRIEDRTRLRGGETIKIGQSTFLLEVAPAGDPGATRVASIPERGATAVRPRPPAPAPEPASAAAPRPAATAAPAPKPAAAAPPVRRPDPDPAPAAPPARPAAAPAHQPAPALVAAAAGPALDAPFARFAPPAPARRPGIASRKIAPSLVSAATIIATAAALIAYFAGR